MGELRTLRRLIFGEWKYQHTHDFDVYPFSEYLKCVIVISIVPDVAAIALRDIMECSVSGFTCIVS